MPALKCLNEKEEQGWTVKSKAAGYKEAPAGLTHMQNVTLPSAGRLAHP